MVQEYDGTIAQLGERMKTLQRQQDVADEQIAQAVSKGVGQRTQQQTQVFTLPNGQTFGIGSVGGGGASTLLPPPQRDLSDLHQHYRQMMAGEAAVLILLGAVAARFVWHRARKSVGAGAGENTGLRNSIDAIAIEVERISENQRYVTKLLTEGAAAPLVGREAGDAVPRSPDSTRR
jgi:hypothetical protein